MVGSVLWIALGLIFIIIGASLVCASSMTAHRRVVWISISIVFTIIGCVFCISGISELVRLFARISLNI